MKKYEHFIFEYEILYDKIKKSDDIGKGDRVMRNREKARNAAEALVEQMTVEEMISQL